MGFMWRKGKKSVSTNIDYGLFVNYSFSTASTLLLGYIV